MTEQDKGNFPGKHQPGEQPNPAIKSEIGKRTTDNAVPCAVAFEIAEYLGVPAAAVGKTVDLLNYPLVKCQLGLYGYTPNRKIVESQESPDPNINTAITEALVDDRLSCKAAWDIAHRFDLPKLTVSGIAESMGIKIKPCQLGAF